MRSLSQLPFVGRRDGRPHGSPARKESEFHRSMAIPALTGSKHMLRPHTPESCSGSATEPSGAVPHTLITRHVVQVASIA